MMDPITIALLVASTAAKMTAKAKARKEELKRQEDMQNPYRPSQSEAVGGASASSGMGLMELARAIQSARQKREVGPIATPALPKMPMDQASSPLFQHPYNYGGFNGLGA